MPHVDPEGSFTKTYSMGRKSDYRTGVGDSTGATYVVGVLHCTLVLKLEPNLGGQIPGRGDKTGHFYFRLQLLFIWPP